MELSEIEAKRQELETNMQDIRKSLKHWQSWDAQYEGLKEELLDLDSEDLDATTVETVTKDCQGDLLTEKEILALVGSPTNDNTAATPLRSRRQILGLIERRQEYVQKNIETLQRRYFVAEGKIEEFAFASMTASGVHGDGIGEGDEGGLPLTEIHEELDDEGNVLSSELRRPEEHRGKVIEHLKMAGLSAKELGVDETAGAEKSGVPIKSALVSPLPSPTKLTNPALESALSSSGSDGEHEAPHRPPIRKKSVSFSADTKLAEEKSQPEAHEGRKSVSFAEKVAIARAADPPDTRSVTFSPEVEEIPAQPLGPSSPVVHPTAVTAPDATPTPVNADLSRQADLRASFKPGEKVYEIDADTETTKPHIVLPANESEENARARQEMLNYHLNEVNNVVAQMDIDDDYEEDDDDDDTHEDGRSVFTASENQDDYASNTSGMSDWETEDEEDEFGRSNTEISDEYRDEMKALQERLIGNMGSAPADEEIKDMDPELDPADVRKLVIRDRRSSMAEPMSSSDPDKKSNSKKRVSFAEELDVATEHVKAQKHVEGESALPLSETVSLRPISTSQATPGAGAMAKTSQFKQRLASSSRPTATQSIHDNDDDDDTMIDSHKGPPGIPMAEHLIERAPSSKPITAPDLEEHDAISARRELAADYYRRRNDIIREQGGFKVNTEEEEDLGELMEERDGKLKKVSRFKAARIGR
nr:hypothetical protein B0A51_10860 [Rachicladosporium sp. CCFEE 5018]